jgi:hypothetical protein
LTDDVSKVSSAFAVIRFPTPKTRIDIAVINTAGRMQRFRKRCIPLGLPSGVQPILRVESAESFILLGRADALADLNFSSLTPFWTTAPGCLE